MANKKLYSGGLKNVRGPMQREMLTGRSANAAQKVAFRAGPVARTDQNAGRADGPLIPINQVAVPPSKKATKGAKTLQ